MAEKLKKFLNDRRKAILIRWWAVGAVYFFVGWGTGLGNQGSLIDFIFFLGLAIGIMNIVVVNPVLRMLFNLGPERNYKDIPLIEKVKRRLGEILKSILIVLIIVYIYNFINMALIKILDLSPETVAFPGEPITFGIIYVIVYLVLEKLKAILFRKGD